MVGYHGHLAEFGYCNYLIVPCLVYFGVIPKVPFFYSATLGQIMKHGLTKPPLICRQSIPKRVSLPVGIRSVPKIGIIRDHMLMLVVIASVYILEHLLLSEVLPADLYTCIVSAAGRHVLLLLMIVVAL